MRKYMILSVILTMAFSIGFMGMAQAKGGHGMAKKDTNQDGVVSEQEFVDYKVKKFERWDTNKDGTVTKAEVETQAKEKFKKMDTNSDGKVTQEEMQAYWKTKKAAPK